MKHLVMQVHGEIVETLCMVVRWASLVISAMLQSVFYTSKVHVQQVPNQRRRTRRKMGEIISLIMAATGMDVLPFS